MTATRRRSRNSSPASPKPPARTSPSSRSGITRPARPPSPCSHRYEPEHERLTLAPQAGHPRDARPHAEVAGAHPGRLRAGRPRRAGPELCRHERRAGLRRRHPSDEEPRGSGVRRREGAAHSLAVPPVLRPGSRRFRSRHSGPPLPRRPRSRPVQSLGGGAADRARHAETRHRRRARRQGARLRSAASPRSWRGLPPTTSSTRPSARWRSACRARSMSRRRSASDVDPDAIHVARRALLVSLGRDVGETLGRDRRAHPPRPALYARRGKRRPARPRARGMEPAGPRRIDGRSRAA